ncbi:MAG: type II secretion system protein [bacterium]|nr:type II secretion system protein [bacterium]
MKKNNNFSLHTRSHNTQGFTLIEMMVSVSLFVIAATIGLGALLIINDAYRKTKAQQVAIDNVNFAMETMTRSIRTGTLYFCGWSDDPNPIECNEPTDAFSYKDIFKRVVVYRLFVDPSTGRGSIQSCASTQFVSCINGDDFVELTAPDIDITELSFYVLDATYTQGQPRLVLIIRGIAGMKEKERTPFSVQTTVTARN